MSTHIANLFDINYLARALVLYKSATAAIPDSTFWFLCLDEESRSALAALKLEHVNFLTVDELHLPELESLRGTRSLTEFAFTAKSNFASYLIATDKIRDGEDLIWADADIMFFSPIKRAMDAALSDHSIAITPHNFPLAKADAAKKVGTYNAGLVLFRIDTTSRKCVAEWAEDCLAWCYNRYEDGKFADQTYLDSWHARYSGVYDLPDKGINLGTWNIGRYTVREAGPHSFKIDADPLICYHFHGFKAYEARNGAIKAYPVTVYNAAIYAEYLQALQDAYVEIRKTLPDFSAGLSPKLPFLKVLKQTIQKIWRNSRKA